MKTVLITGGGGGIGRATAMRFAAAGLQVVIAGRNQVALDLVTTQIAASGGRALSISTDVTKNDQVQKMMERALERFGRLDILVNNAGVAATGAAKEFPVEMWEWLLAVNLTGVFLCCRAAIPIMEKQMSGHVINVASVAANVGFAGWSAYCASKAGVAGFTRALREEVRAAGIRVSLMLPGSVNTPLWDTFPNTFDRARMLTDDQVADAIYYVATQPSTVSVDELSLAYPAGNQ